MNMLVHLSTNQKLLVSILHQGRIFVRLTSTRISLASKKKRGGGVPGVSLSKQTQWGEIGSGIPTSEAVKSTNVKTVRFHTPYSIQIPWDIDDYICSIIIILKKEILRTLTDLYS